MKSILCKNDATKKEVILIGDFNINLLDFDKNKRAQSVNLMFRLGMIPTINKPTRVIRHTTTAVDHVFTNTVMDNIEIKTSIVKTSISDHFLIISGTKSKVTLKLQSNTFLHVIIQTSQSIILRKVTQCRLEQYQDFTKCQ